MAMFMVSSAPSDQDINLEHPDSLEGKGLPVEEDKLMDFGFPDSGNEPNLFQKQGQSLEEEGEFADFSLGDLESGKELDDRYIGFCKDAYILMWPGNSRKFWSYGYVYLKQPYVANCTMKYLYNTRNYPADPFCKFGFRVTGSFEGHSDGYTDCTDTDYVLLNDTNGNAAYYCGTYSTIDWITAEDDFEFHFVTKADSPRAKGFFTVIRSFKLCGGLYTVEKDGPSGNLLSPLYPENYPPNLSCNYYFQLDPNDGREISIRIGCYSYNLEDPFNNGTDYCLDATVFTYEAPYIHTPMVYCSNTLDNNNHVIYSTHNSLLVSFRTNSAVEQSGYNCSYEFIRFGE